ncbi:kinase-like domain-containing protein [Annulohypoxylon bovei var. microspora]|nr:kinase-like domain-containing protein [Annulohypoxylon bovei var. microspora]
MVRRLTFDDGISWVARVRLPPEATPAPLDWYDSRRAFEVEVASMKFFKSKSTVPVPELFAYDANSSNEVGVCWMLMEYIHGTTAAELQIIKDSEPAIYGSIEQDRKLRDQMAKIQAEVLSFKFQDIGSLYYSEDTSSFFIGPDVETGKGPWKLSTDYYYDLADNLLKNTAARCSEKAKNSPSFILPTLLNHLLGIHSEERAGPFRLVNADFGAHNILVDDDFNVVGIVDFDGVRAAPLEAAAQFPVLSCMGLEPPGHVDPRPAVQERIKRSKPQIDRYKEFLIKHEAELGDGSAPVGHRLGSTSALIYKAFQNYSMLSTSSYEKWFEFALKVTRDYADGLEASEGQVQLAE